MKERDYIEVGNVVKARAAHALLCVMVALDVPLLEEAIAKAKDAAYVLSVMCSDRLVIEP
jgi:hypothetical protein